LADLKVVWMAETMGF
jgi:hypothetical protein